MEIVEVIVTAKMDPRNGVSVSNRAVAATTEMIRVHMYDNDKPVRIIHISQFGRIFQPKRQNTNIMVILDYCARSGYFPLRVEIKPPRRAMCARAAGSP